MPETLLMSTTFTFIELLLLLHLQLVDLCPSQNSKTPTLYARRYFISSNKPLLTRNCGINVDELIKTLDQKGMYELLQDITMTPVIFKRNSSTPAIKHIGWSPVVLKHKLRSLLVLITDGGSLDIYYFWRDSWICGASVSNAWYYHCYSQWEEVSKESIETLKELKIRTYKIKFSAFAWGASVKKSWFDLFISSCDGTLSMWRVNQDVETKKLNIALVKEFQTEREIITALHCQYIPPQQYVIFLCFIDGRIASVVIDIKEEDMNVSEVNFIWDEKDKIQVYSGGLFSRLLFDSSALTIMAQVVKGRHILILNVNFDGSLRSYNVVVSQELSLTGLVSLSQTESLISGYSGSMYVLTLKDLEPSLMKLQDSLRTMHYACNGIAISKSRCMAAVPYSVRTNYDHLAMKELCNILWCSLYNISEANEILFKHSGPLSEIWDVVEIMRIESILKGSGIIWNMPAEDFDTMDSSKLKKYLALLQLSLILENDERVSAKDDKVKMENEIQELLTSCHIFKKVSHLMTISELNDFEEFSLFLMKKWIGYIIAKYTSKYKHTTTVAATLQEQLDNLNFKYNSEMCNICEEEIPQITDMHYAVCSSGHVVPRCSLSLVQCTDLPYYLCYKCNIIADSRAVSEEHNCCIFCDNVLRLSEMVMCEDEQQDIVDIQQSPTGNRTQSPTADIPLSPTASMPQSPRENTAHSPSPNISHSPKAGAEDGPAADITHSPTADIAQSPRTDIPQSPIADIPQSPTAHITQSTIADIPQSPGENTLHSLSPNVSHSPKADPQHLTTTDKPQSPV